MNGSVSFKVLLSQICPFIEDALLNPSLTFCNHDFIVVYKAIWC